MSVSGFPVLTSPVIPIHHMAKEKVKSGNDRRTYRRRVQVFCRTLEVRPDETPLAALNRSRSELGRNTLLHGPLPLVLWIASDTQVAELAWNGRWEVHGGIEQLLIPVDWVPGKARSPADLEMAFVTTADRVSFRI